MAQAILAIFLILGMPSLSIFYFAGLCIKKSKHHHSFDHRARPSVNLIEFMKNCYLMCKLSCL